MARTLLIVGLIVGLTGTLKAQSILWNSILSKSDSIQLANINMADEMEKLEKDHEKAVELAQKEHALVDLSEQISFKTQGLVIAMADLKFDYNCYASCIRNMEKTSLACLNECNKVRDYSWFLVQTNFFFC